MEYHFKHKSHNSSSFTLFMNMISKTFYHCFPVESIKINYKNRNHWINKKLKNEIKVRDNLFLLYKHIPTQKNRDNNKKYKNINLSNQRKAERDFYREQFDLHQTDLKKSWKVIKNIIGKDDNRSCTQHNDFLLNNQYISDDTIIANAFNNYFISVGRSLAKNIRSDTNPILYV